jgi:hypothetical protein
VPFAARPVRVWLVIRRLLDVVRAAKQLALVHLGKQDATWSIEAAGDGEQLRCRVLVVELKIVRRRAPGAMILSVKPDSAR